MVVTFRNETLRATIFFYKPMCKITLSAASGRRDVVQTDTLHQMPARSWQPSRTVCGA
ncbi:hypothetical protein CIP106467_2877 [Citrobacter europaeus]|nr:hypothetical protein CIP106467_2877 [Citrobacter europaeus]